MDYANKLLLLSCEFVKEDKDGILALIARWEEHVDNPDGVYLRLSKRDEMSYFISLEVHIAHELMGDAEVPDYRSYKKEAFAGKPISEVVDFFAGHNKIQPIDGQYVVSRADIQAVLDWVLYKHEWVAANDHCWYLSCANNDEMLVIMQAAMKLQQLGRDYTLSSYPSVWDTRPILRYFPNYEPAYYVDVFKAGPKLFKLAAYEDSFRTDDPIEGFLHPENVALKHPMSVDGYTIIVHLDDLTEMILSTIK